MPIVFVIQKSAEEDLARLKAEQSSTLVVVESEEDLLTVPEKAYPNSNTHIC